MCGIYGYWSRDKGFVNHSAMHKMAGALRHRGPDDEGWRSDEERGMALGNRRLSIIDLEHGKQPFVSDDGAITVVQNGEIFNYIELASELRQCGIQLRTESDTEVILRLYEKEGLDCLDKLNGMFAIAIDDARNDQLYLIRDRLGVKPLFYTYHNNTLYFASEIKALIAAGVVDQSRLDKEALHHYLTFNYVPPPYTMYRQVKHVMPGMLLALSRNKPDKATRWWNLAQQQERDYDYDDWASEFLGLLESSINIRMRSDVPFGAFLSGGVDSSAVVGIMSRQLERPVQSFAIGFKDKRFDESEHAELAAKRFGTIHTMQIVESDMLDNWPHVMYHLDQPHGDASFMPVHKLSELASRSVKVVLTGDGGDELFAGYEKYQSFFENMKEGGYSRDNFQKPYFESISLFRDSEKMELYTKSVARELDGLSSFDEVARPWLEEACHFDPVNQAMYLDTQLLLCGNNLVKPDRMGMAVSIEARTPFLDWRIVEFAFRSRGVTKLNNGDKKHWFKKSVESLIGKDLAYRKKQMFTVPVGEWFRGARATWLEERLFSSELISTLFDKRRIEDMLKKHLSGELNKTRELRALAALAIWGSQNGY